VINTDPNHKHTYDAQGKMTCCTQEEKIYTKAGAKELLKDGHSHDDGHDHNHEEGDGHDHSGNGNSSTLKMFLPAIISLLLLLAAIVFDNWIPQSWFTGWVRIVWYVTAYLPVGFPVIKEAVESIGKRRLKALVKEKYFLNFY